MSLKFHFLGGKRHSFKKKLQKNNLSFNICCLFLLFSIKYKTEIVEIVKNNTFCFYLYFRESFVVLVIFLSTNEHICFK